MGCRVLIAEEDSELRGFFVGQLQQSGFDVAAVADGEAAVAAAKQALPRVVLVGTLSQELSGIPLVRSLTAVSDRIQVIMLTETPCVDNAVSALRAGVCDYLRKPDDLGRVVESVRSAAKRNGHSGPAQQSSSPARNELSGTGRSETAGTHFGGRTLVGTSAAMQTVMRKIREVAASEMTVLIRGETGTGKDVVAQVLHELSPRVHSGDFCKINCPSVQENLLESEMFGYEKGAFTGAERQRPGRFEMADAGTVFLDEIGTMSRSAQAKLLEVIEYKSFFRVGGTQKISVDVRIIAATNSPLEDDVKRGTFRPDLFYRLHAYTIFIPPLRDRLEDILPLVDYFRNKYGAKYVQDQPPLPPEVMACLMRYDWPGNVRELEGIISRYMLTGNAAAVLESVNGHATPVECDARSVLEQRELQTLQAALAQTGWNQRQAARILGVSYSALRRRVAKYTLEKPGTS